MFLPMEMSWNMKNWPKVMEFCDQLWNLTNFVPELYQRHTCIGPSLYQICIFFVTTKKLSSDLESLHFPTFSAKRPKCKIGKRNGHGQIFCQICGNPATPSRTALFNADIYWFP